MSAMLTYNGTLVVATCWCGVRHGVPEELYEFVQGQHRDGKAQTSIYCPLGHQWSFAGEGKAAQLERELEWARNAQARTNARADQAEASARAYKGVATKARRRAKAGTCPCCKRTFKQLAQHMASQHPDFAPEAV